MPERETDIEEDFLQVDTDRVIYPQGFNPYRETLRLAEHVLDLLDRVIAEAGVGDIPTPTRTNGRNKS